MISYKPQRACTYVFACVILVVSIGLLLPIRPNVTPIQGYIAAFPNDKVTIVIPYRFNRWNLSGTLWYISGIDLAPKASVLSYSVNKRSLSCGTINVLARPNEDQENGKLEEAKLRYAKRWYPVYIGDVTFDIRHGTGDRSLFLSENAITKYSRFEEPYEMRLVNVSNERISILGIEAPGVRYLGNEVVVEPGDTVILTVEIDAKFDLVRPWILYRTSTGEHLMPGASCYLICVAKPTYISHCNSKWTCVKVASSTCSEISAQGCRLGSHAIQDHRP